MNIFANYDPTKPFEEYLKGGKSVTDIATLQPEVKLPDWLTTNPDDLMRELHAMYSRIPGLMNPAAITKSYDDAIATTTGMGGQIANNAASEAVARGGITGGQINSEMVKAQSMLPVYDTTNKLRTDKALAVADQNKSQASMMAQLASTMGNLRANYLSSLGQLHNQRQQTTNSWTMGQQQLSQSALAQQRAYEASMRDLATRSSAASGGGGSGMTAADDAGYIPNSGPIRAARGIFNFNGNNVSVGYSSNAKMGVDFRTAGTPAAKATQSAGEYNAMQEWLQQNQNHRYEEGYKELYA
jgi:hypothetical protein